MSRARTLKLVAAVAVVLLVPLIAYAWSLLRVEDVPEQLDPVELDPDDIVIPGTGDAPPLEIAKLRGKTAFFVVVGAQTGKSTEGERLNRALNRWTYPDTTLGFIIGDAEGFGLFRDRVAEVMGHFADEVRYPFYVDYEGAFVNTFALPKGHHAFVVLGPQGRVLWRESGGIEDPAQIEHVRELLGGDEPEPGPPLPDFALHRMSDEACAGTPCVLVFPGAPVRLREVPGPDNGFEGDDESRYAQMRIPRIRNVQICRRMHMKRAMGVMVGDVDPALTFVGWDRVPPDDPEAVATREAFEIDPEQAALVVIADGRVAMRETGLVPLYRWGLAASLLHVENFDDRRPPKR